jgi:hypothetical protein
MVPEEQQAAFREESGRLRSAPCGAAFSLRTRFMRSVGHALYVYNTYRACYEAEAYHYC